MAHLPSWGAEVLPHFLGLMLNFLTGSNKLKEMRVDQVLQVEEEYWMDLRDNWEFRWTILDVGVLDRVLPGLGPRFVLSNKMADGAIWWDCCKSSGWPLML